MTYLADHTFLIYGASATLATAFAVMSGRWPLIIIGALLFADWVAWNLTLATWGFVRAPVLLPTEDAMWLGFTVLLNRRALHDGTVRMVAYLFGVAIITWLTFIGTGRQNTYACYATANLVYLCQVAVVGGSGAWRAVSAGMARRHWRRDLRPAGGRRIAGVHAAYRAEE